MQQIETTYFDLKQNFTRQWHRVTPGESPQQG